MIFLGGVHLIRDIRYGGKYARHGDSQCGEGQVIIPYIDLLEEVLKGQARTAIGQKISRAENSLNATLGRWDSTHETTQRGKSCVV